jgi:hypothetical protein
VKGHRRNPSGAWAGGRASICAPERSEIWIVRGEGLEGGNGEETRNVVGSPGQFRSVAKCGCVSPERGEVWVRESGARRSVGA